jgi:glucose/arabinose dehydrogenase
MGLAVDPDFGANRHIYTCYTAGARGAANATDVRIVRWTVAADYRSLGAKTPILTGIPAGDVGAAGNRHVGCRIAFGPDGMLWATTGDAVIPTAPQDPGSLAGKVLRLTRTGAPAPGNPGGSWNPYVFTIGHRNPQGLAFRASDGWAFIVEHGTGCDDEVNLLVAGGNYGWNPVTAGGGYNENASMTSPGGRPAAWSSGCPTVAPSGGTFLSHPGWGDWQGSLVVANLKAQQLTRMPTQGGAVTGIQRVLDGYGRLRATTIGPGGALWVLTDASPGRLLRVQPTF